MYLPPSVFEWQPNPIIFHHLRGEHLESLQSGPSIATSTPEYHLMDTSELVEGLYLDTAIGFDNKNTTKDNQKSPDAPRHTGPTTMSTNLSSFACPQCNFTAKRNCALKYVIIFSLMLLPLNYGSKHVAQTHKHRFKCVHYGCGKSFGLRTNLERHQTTHTERKKFKCPNPWCKIPGRTFTRNDNLGRHLKLCVASK